MKLFNRGHFNTVAEKATMGPFLAYSKERKQNRSILLPPHFLLTITEFTQSEILQYEENT